MTLVKYAGANDNAVLVEVEDVGGGYTPVASAGEVAASATQAFEDAMGAIRPTADAFLSQVTTMARRPAEARLDFELGLDFEAGAFIAKLGGKANFKVSLTWKAEQPDG